MFVLYFFTQVSVVTKPPPVGADPCVCPTPKGVTLRLNRWNMSFRHWADTWVRPYNREVTALPKLKFLYLFIALKSEGFIPVFALNFEEK